MFTFVRFEINLMKTIFPGRYTKKITFQRNFIVVVIFNNLKLKTNK